MCFHNRLLLETTGGDWIAQLLNVIGTENIGPCMWRWSSGLYLNSPAGGSKAAATGFTPWVNREEMSVWPATARPSRWSRPSLASYNSSTNSSNFNIRKEFVNSRAAIAPKTIKSWWQRNETWRRTLSGSASSKTHSPDGPTSIWKLSINSSAVWRRTCQTGSN